MFKLESAQKGTIKRTGRVDASVVEHAETFFDGVTEPAIVDLAGLDYISSAGLAVLLRTQKRLMSAGGGLTLRNVNPHILDILRYSGFDQVFQIEPAHGK